MISFNFLSALIFSESENSDDFDANKFKIFNSAVENLQAGNKISNILSIPFIILNSLFLVLGLVVTGFVVSNIFIETILFIPITIIILIDYVFPLIRGN